jgi:hypothetical protein
MNAANEIEVRRDEQPPVAASESAAIFSMIERAARDPSVDLDKMERLMQMQERVMERNAKAAYAASFARMQPELPVIGQKGKNTNTKQTYAKWEDIAEAIAPVLSRHGFSISFRVENASGNVSVTGVLMHEQGHSTETTLPLPVDTGAGRNAVQAVGSSVSYGKRYTAGLLLNFVSRDQQDDDGNAAVRGATITTDQVKELRDLLDAKGGDVRKLCEYLKVESLADIEASGFAKVKAAIIKKGQRND